MMSNANRNQPFCQFAVPRGAFDKAGPNGDNGFVPALLHLEISGREPSPYDLGNTTSIGRAPGNQICLADDTAVSRQHAMIRLQGEQEYYLIDLGSRQRDDPQR